MASRGKMADESQVEVVPTAVQEETNNEQEVTAVEEPQETTQECLDKVCLHLRCRCFCRLAGNVFYTPVPLKV